MITLDELLIKVGVDASQAKQIGTYIDLLQSGADGITNNANLINKKLDEVLNDVSSSLRGASDASQKASNDLQKSGNQADKTGKKFSKLKITMAALIGGAILFGNKIASAFNAAIDNAESLFKSKNALFSISQKEIKQVEHYKKTLEGTRLAIDSVRTKIAINLIPTITAISNQFNSWLVSNRELVVKGIGKTIEWIGKAVQVVTNFIKFIDKIVKNTIGWKNALIGLGIAWAILNRAFLFSPIGRMIAYFGILLLLVDDLMVYMRGGKSLFGEYWDPLINGAKSVVDWFNSLSETGKKVIGASGILSVLMIAFGGTTLKVIGVFIKGFKMMGVAVKALTMIMRSNPIIAILTAVAVIAYLIYDNWEWLSQKFKGIWSDISSYCTEAWNTIVSTVSNAIKDVLMYFGLSEDKANAVVAAIGAHFSFIFDLIALPFKAAYEFVVGLFGILGDDSLSFVDKLGAIFALMFNIVTAPFKKAMNWISDKFMGFVNGIQSKVTGLLSKIGINIGNDDKSDGSSSTPSVINDDLMYTYTPQAPNLSSIDRSTTNNRVETRATVNVYTSDNRDGARQVGDLLAKQAREASNYTKSSAGR